MLSGLNPFYDPYPFPYLPFFHAPTNITLQNDRHINQNNEFFEEVVSIISHLELHTQTESPIITLGICFPLWLFLTITAIFIQILIGFGSSQEPCRMHNSGYEHLLSL